MAPKPAREGTRHKALSAPAGTGYHGACGRLPHARPISGEGSMGILLGLARALGALNAALLAAGRHVGTVCVGLMVAFILVQVFFRYILNDAPAWTEEGARFLMLWMTGLMAPTAFRRGGFVAIDTLAVLIPRRIGLALHLLLLLVSLAILVAGLRIAWAEVTGFVGRAPTDALRLPLNLGLTEWFKIPKSWARASIAVGATLLLLVNVELIVRALVRLAGAEDRLPPIRQMTVMEAE